MKALVIFAVAFSIDRMIALHTLNQKGSVAMIRNDTLFVQSNKHTTAELREIAELAKCELVVVRKRKSK